LESLLISAGIVALAETGDKTQLLTLLLAARYHKPCTIVAGIFVATLLNHALAGAAGAWIAAALPAETLRLVLGASFLLMAGWILVPDKLDPDGLREKRFGGVLVTSAVLFFLAEIGDKTQIATVALAARFDSLAAVVLGTTLGMLIANVPVAMFGSAAGKRLPVAAIRATAATVFALLGVGVLVLG
jgi:putative Ca2+/H+ antiporter (TMEM165/GDT1 family)